MVMFICNTKYVSEKNINKDFKCYLQTFLLKKMFSVHAIWDHQEM